MHLINRTPSLVWRSLGSACALAMLLVWGAALAQTEPTMDQVYAAAKSGELDKAQTMIQQVLIGHPNSAKAHYVQAEIAARQGQLPRAREALATAEKLAPGLPFAKAESVQALRTQLAGSASATPTAAATPAAEPAPAAKSLPWGLILLFGGAGIALLIFLVNRASRPRPSVFGNAIPVANPGLNGPQTFGNQAPVPYGQQPYGPQYGPQYAQQGPSLGGRIMGGVATGLAVGAGVMAAEAIGRNLMGGEHGSDASPHAAPPETHYAPPDANADMGGQDFGIQDSGSWDSGGGDSWD
ncbi:MAG: tetratricopeptide repeat protein [Betaproteobacteria bacterium]|nr:tetratricopeptide repeat protein [Betaproteobacteria bacterium]